MATLPKILSQKLAAQSQLFRVESLELAFSNGEQRTYERLLGRGAAVIIVGMLDDDRVVLVNEYGVGLERYELGLPKGKVDKGESFEEAANRELQEEAGYGARRLTLLKRMAQSPSYMQHSTQIVLAQDLYPATVDTGDEPEPLGVEICRLSELDTLVLREDLSEARTIAALYLVRAYLAQE